MVRGPGAASVAAGGAATAGQRSGSWGIFPYFFVPFAAASAYVLFIALILHPTFQAHNVFLHALNYPFASTLRAPWSVKGMPKQHENRVRNFYTVSADGTRIGGWHIAPKRAHAQDDETLSGKELDVVLDQDLVGKPVLIFFHGNALNRGAPIRIRAYRTFLKHDVNVVAIDYRGFGDSEGIPTEAGLLQDARAAYKWIVDRRRRAMAAQAGRDTKKTVSENRMHADILLAGQSLGTGAAARLTLDLIDAGAPPAGVLLIAPYTSIFGLLTSYRIGGFLPVFWPLSLSSALTNLADKYLLTRFESDKALLVAACGGRQRCQERGHGDAEDKEEDATNALLSPASAIQQLEHLLPADELCSELGVETQDASSSAPLIVISHADNDRIIPCAHGHSLFDTTRMAHAANAAEKREGDTMTHDAEWGSLVVAIDDDNLSRMTSRFFGDEPHAPLALFKNKKGGHNSVPVHIVQWFIETALGRKEADKDNAKQGAQL